MIIPSVDILRGHAVQLVGGKVEKLEVDAGDPIPLVLKFRIAGEIAVVDLDAALGQGSNGEIVEKILKMAPFCRVGGGIRSVESALYWLNAGAKKIVLGTLAREDILVQLPRDRVIAALDIMYGQVVIEGWKTKTNQNVWERIEALKPYVRGFLVTFVEREGRLGGVDLAKCEELKKVIGSDHELTIAGGISTLSEIVALDRMGVQAQVGMALYTKKMDLGLAFAAPLTSDRPDHLIPTVVVDEHYSILGLVYSSEESIRMSFETQQGWYCSRKRGLWQKGSTSGATQKLVRIHIDCDKDSLCFVVRQSGDGFCHRSDYSCFGPCATRGISKLFELLEDRLDNSVSGSYTNRLFEDEKLLNAKIREEAAELTEAHTKDEIIRETADVLYFALVKAVKHNVTLADIENELDYRSLKVTRRPGNAKLQYTNS